MKIDRMSLILKIIKMLREKIAEGDFLLLADEQTAGRGRLGRSWLSTAGDGLYMSFAIEVDIDKAPSALTIATGVAVLNALEEQGLKSVKIKWPNDILINGKKVCGILSELIEVDGKFFAIIGVGVNIRHSYFEGELSEKASSLFLEGLSIKTEDLAICLVLSFIKVYNKFKKTKNLEPFMPILNEKIINIGKSAVFQHEGKEKIGEVLRINKNGSISILVNGELVDIYSGEIIWKNLT